MEFYLGCSGWNYGDIPEKGGWLDIFYPTKDTKRLRYYSEFFDTVEMDSIFYEEFYSKMTKGIFFAMIAIGYVITTILIFFKPNNVIPYYVLLIGTVAILIVYYFRTMTGIPIPGTDSIIKEYFHSS